MRLNDELRDKLAAEYALGTLRGRARERVRRRLREDPELARAVAAWDARLAPMTDAVAPVSPPAGLWRRIENRIEPAKKQTWWKPLAWIASGAVAALVAVALLLPAQRAEIPPSYFAVLSDPKTNQPVLIATAQREAMVLHVSTLDPKIHVAGRSLELWALPRGAQPKSLGVLAGARSELKLLAVADRALGDVPALAISLEPPGGSPTGQPTGPVLYTGPCVKYW